MEQYFWDFEVSGRLADHVLTFEAIVAAYWDRYKREKTAYEEKHGKKLIFKRVNDSTQTLTRYRWSLRLPSESPSDPRSAD